MRTFRLRNDLNRHSLSGFQLPLGLEPTEPVRPREGYTVEFVPGGADAAPAGDAPGHGLLLDGRGGGEPVEVPDTFRFEIVTSFERIAPLLRSLFELLPDEVYPVVESIGKDAYRAVDVFVAREAVEFDDFMDVWMEYEQVILEDGGVGGGAQADEPYMEIFIDSWKIIAVHVPVEMKEDVERVLAEHGVEEVEHTWPPEVVERPESPMTVRDILVVEDESSPDIDEILFQLREAWGLELDVDPETNQDENGNRLGRTLWYVIAVLDSPEEGDPPRSAYGLAWLTAGSLGEAQRMVATRLEQEHEWVFGNRWYTLDRVAYDERPEALADLAPRRTRSEIHLFSIEPA